MDAVIRKARKTDAEQIGNVHYKAWIETYTGLLPEAYLAMRSAEKSIALFCKTECQNLVVVEIAGNVVGFCGWGSFRDSDADNRMGEIQGIYLLNEYKRKQLGRRMLNYALERLKAAGYSQAGLWVLNTNNNAIQFYEKMGFEHSAITKTADLGQPITELLYTKRL